MSKNIVFCADGTWNGMRQGDDGEALDRAATNVVRFYTALAGEVTPDSLRLQDEQEKVACDGETVVQVAKYLHGVGDGANVIGRILGGVFGEGFLERIVRGYTFVSRNYQPGDRIHLVGFSRGSYTVRALGGMIARCGLLPTEAALADDGTWDAEKAYRQGIYVWAQYRRAANKQSTLLGYLEEFKATPVPLDSLVGAPIASIGVWDTVGSLGIPLDNPADAQRVDVFAFADTALSPSVAHGFHALAIDEQREDFAPTLWDPRDGVEQLWFSGAHADVGGGYPSLEFCGVSLDWMVARMRSIGLVFSSRYAAAAPGPFGPCHTPYKEAPFNLRPHAARAIPDGSLFHPSVQARLAGFADYDPDNLGAFLVGRTLRQDVVFVE